MMGKMCSVLRMHGEGCREMGIGGSMRSFRIHGASFRFISLPTIIQRLHSSRGIDYSSFDRPLFIPRPGIQEGEGVIIVINIVITWLHASCLSCSSGAIATASRAEPYLIQLRKLLSVAVEPACGLQLLKRPSTESFKVEVGWRSLGLCSEASQVSGSIFSGRLRSAIARRSCSSRSG